MTAIEPRLNFNFKVLDPLYTSGAHFLNGCACCGCTTFESHIGTTNLECRNCMTKYRFSHNQKYLIMEPIDSKLLMKIQRLYGVR